MPRPNWSRALPLPLWILDDGKKFLRLSTLADVGAFLKHLPKERRLSDTWQVASRRLDDALANQDSAEDLSVTLQMAFQLERIEYRLDTEKIGPSRRARRPL